MKKGLIIILLIFTIFFMSACKSNSNLKDDPNAINDEMRDKFNDLDESITINKYNKGWGGDTYRKFDIECEEIKKIKDFYENLFITSEGKLYRISFDKIFSNEKNCKEVKSDINFKGFIGGGILDDENKIYYIDEIDGNLKEYDFHNGPITMPYYIKNISKKKLSKITSVTRDNENILYFLIDDNKIYKYERISIADSTLKLIDEPIMVFEDEIIDCYVDGVIKTNKHFYIYNYKKANQEQCDKYADIECIYEDAFSVIKELDKDFNNVVFYKPGIIVDANNNVYTSLLGP